MTPIPANRCGDRGVCTGCEIVAGGGVSGFVVSLAAGWWRLPCNDASQSGVNIQGGGQFRLGANGEASCRSVTQPIWPGYRASIPTSRAASRAAQDSALRLPEPSVKHRPRSSAYRDPRIAAGGRTGPGTGRVVGPDSAPDRRRRTTLPDLRRQTDLPEFPPHPPTAAHTALKLSPVNQSTRF